MEEIEGGRVEERKINIMGGRKETRERVQKRGGEGEGGEREVSSGQSLLIAQLTKRFY